MHPREGRGIWAQARCTPPLLGGCLAGLQLHSSSSRSRGTLGWGDIDTLFPWPLGQWVVGHECSQRRPLPCPFPPGPGSRGWGWGVGRRIFLPLGEFYLTAGARTLPPRGELPAVSAAAVTAHPLLGVLGFLGVLSSTVRLVPGGSVGCPLVSAGWLGNAVPLQTGSRAMTRSVSAGAAWAGQH